MRGFETFFLKFSALNVVNDVIDISTYCILFNIRTPLVVISKISFPYGHGLVTENINSKMIIMKTYPETISK